MRRTGDVREHANMERAAIEGGYGRRQLFELIQNGADELLESTRKIHVVLTEDTLYCANEGKPLSVEGVGALLSSHLSPKMGVEIGRFGLGFKSVLAITTRPEVFSRSGSIAFDPGRGRRAHPQGRSRSRTDTHTAHRLVDRPERGRRRRRDPRRADVLGDDGRTAVRDTADSSWLPEDLTEFPSEFLLFSPHVAELILETENAARTRTIAVPRGATANSCSR